MSELPRRRAFRLTERALSPACREIEVAGDLDLAVADRLREAIEAATEPHVLVGLGGCELLDSTGIAVIVHAHLVMARDGRRLVVHSPSRDARRILEIAGLADSDIVFEDAAAALASCGEPAQAVRKSER